MLETFFARSCIFMGKLECMETSDLFKNFDPVSAKAWKQKIQYGLKGADYTKELVWESPEGIKVKPFYDQEDRAKLPTQLASNTLQWKLGETIFVTTAQKANQKAKKALKKGVESLLFILPDEISDLDQFVSDIAIQSVPLHFQCQFLSPDFIKSLSNLLSNKAKEVHFHIDPVGHLARNGHWFEGQEQDFVCVDTISEKAPKGFEGSLLTVDATLYQNAGANHVQELAYALCHGSEYLNRTAHYPSHEMHFKMAIGGNYFFEIAKLQALRLLWKTVAKAHGASEKCHISATPSKRNKTVYDYNTNLLRTTTECMAAILGGADTIYNLPYDHLYHKDNDFAKRIARNQLLLLKHESFFEGDDNPVSGSYYIESLVHQLASKALELFKQIEASGGFLKQLKSHAIQRKIKESAQKEQLRFDQQHEVLIGTNKYVQENERMKDALERYPFIKTKPRKTLIEPILPKRLAEVIEKERLQQEGMKV